jgi:hypothetical protein
MKKLFYVGVFLNEKIFFAPYGFTNYGDVFAEATTPAEASQMAKEHFKTKFRVEPTGTRTTVADPKFCSPGDVLKRETQIQTTFI